MFRTIKSQISLVSVTLVLLLLSQVFLSRNIQSTFVDSLDLTQEAVVKVSLVRKLERDVIDLQRNVLIYKESASESAVTRFNLLMKENQANLTQLQELTAEELQSDVYQDYITRMRSHLNDYRENFSSVIVGRTKRQTLYNSGLLADLENIFDGISVDPNAQPDKTIEHLQEAKYHIARAENFLLKYLLTPEQELVQPFQTQLTAAKFQIQQLAPQEQLTQSLEKLSTVEKDFLQLTQITRGYLFLVNVVMAGSANEFLFLARELNRLVTGKLTNTNQNVKATVDSTRIGSDLFSVFGIILAAATALFLIYRIMLPINIITDVFQKLTKGKNVKSIPGLTRRDEIGQLAQAADVFHEKNKQTTTLLEQSQLLNARQEALNNQLTESNQKAEQATTSKSIFLANMSHEIRTPMNGIIGMLEVILRSDLTSSQREQLTKVAYSGQILLSLINDILDFSKIEAGKLDIENIDFSLNSMFSNVLANISTRAQEKNLNIGFHVNPNLPSQLVGDPLRISQVLLNLCSNAIKFTRNGSVLIKVDFETIENTDAINLWVEVIDTGIGMSKEQVSKVFDSFTQADGSTSRTFGGTGLGLSIVKQLTDLMGGEVSVQSEEDKGSKFKASFTLNRVDSSPPDIIPATKLSGGKLYYFSGGREGLLSDEYIEKVVLNYHHLPLSQLSSTLEMIKDEDAVLLDISDQAVFRTFYESIDTLSKRSLNIGFVTNTQPSNLPNQLTTMWSAGCLSHPFSPQVAANFLISLLSKQDASEAYLPSQPEETQNATYEGHVLLVEDNNINQAVAGEMLKILGLTYDVAEDGHQAVTKVINSPHYDLVLMDIQMPLMDGYEATQTIRRQGHKELIICGLSANAMKQDFAKAKEAGMNDYITKPLKQKVLENMIDKYLQKKN